jgi:hypothetical protein
MIDTPFACYIKTKSTVPHALLFPYRELIKALGYRVSMPWIFIVEIISASISIYFSDWCILTLCTLKIALK